MFYPPFAFFRRTNPSSPLNYNKSLSNFNLVLFINAYNMTLPLQSTWDTVVLQSIYSLAYLVAFPLLFFWLTMYGASLLINIILTLQNSWLDLVLPKKGGQRRFVCFCFTECRRRKVGLEHQKLLDADADIEDVYGEEADDEDVATERKLIESGTLSSATPLIISGIQKVFKSTGSATDFLLVSPFSFELINACVFVGRKRCMR